MFMKKTKKIEETYKTIIDSILDSFTIPANFGTCENGEIENIYYKHIKRLCKHISKKITPITIEHGVSKLVIIPRDYPFVIKIPFIGIFEVNDDLIPKFYDYEGHKNPDELAEFYNKQSKTKSKWMKQHYKEILSFYEFENACDEDCSDYCLDELQKYEKVANKDFSAFFAKTFWYCNKNGRNIYIQEKANPYSSSRSTIIPSKKSAEKANKLSADFPKDWLAVAIECYGENIVESFLNYADIDEDDIEIYCDMHYGNFGYRPNGTPCLIDFSGWRDDY